MERDDMAKRTCSVEGCERLEDTRGWCERHYTRWLRYGNPTAGRFSPDTPYIERFRAKYVVDENGCWLWTASCVPEGYGKFKAGPGAAVRAHRWAYEHFVGPIPDGLFVLHRCDVRQCVNPAHLFVGTQLDNMADMIGKGRARWAYRIAPQEAQAIRASYTGAWGEQRALAAKYGVSPATIHRIIHGGETRWPTDFFQTQTSAEN